MNLIKSSKKNSGKNLIGVKALELEYQANAALYKWT
jgi:hypothetical protein